MNILTIAEGIETIDEHRCAVELGCDLLQGFLYGRPAKALTSGRKTKSSQALPCHIRTNA